jgi:hypothetical protein
MTQTVRELLTECVCGKHSEDHVFSRGDGTPVLEFRCMWASVCYAAAGVGGANRSAAPKRAACLIAGNIVGAN